MVARVLVTGGAGYIGSHTVSCLLDAGYECVVLDDLSTGHRAAVPAGAPLVHASLAQPHEIAEAFRTFVPDAVIHLAGSIEPAESMVNPRLYYRNNLVCGVNLLDTVIDHGNAPVVFSSSCAVYGQPARSPVAEDDPKSPVSVYGETKLAFERMLAAYGHAYGLRSISLRYFNACGAHPEATIGDDHTRQIHLMTVAVLTALGRRKQVEVFGADYPTPDGTCLRDFIHVMDLASAHVLAVGALLNGRAATQYNVGIGKGWSVLEVIETVERVTGREVPYVVRGRRSGDPAALFADPRRIAAELGWTPEWPGLEDMVSTAWQWHSRHPDGFADKA